MRRADLIEDDGRISNSRGHLGEIPGHLRKPAEEAAGTLELRIQPGPQRRVRRTRPRGCQRPAPPHLPQRHRLPLRSGSVGSPSSGQSPRHQNEDGPRRGRTAAKHAAVVYPAQPRSGWVNIGSWTCLGLSAWRLWVERPIRYMPGSLLRGTARDLRHRPRRPPNESDRPATERVGTAFRSNQGMQHLDVRQVQQRHPDHLPPCRDRRRSGLVGAASAQRRGWSGMDTGKGPTRAARRAPCRGRVCAPSHSAGLVG